MSSQAQDTAGSQLPTAESTKSKKPPHPAFLRKSENSAFVQKPKRSFPPGSNALAKRKPLQKKPVSAAELAASTPSEPYEDIPIVTTKRTLLQGLRHHVIRFHPGTSSATRNVDPTNEQQFVRPVRLHRRHPRMNPFGQVNVSGEGTKRTENGNSSIDSKDRELQEKLKAEKREEREANLAQMAPTSKDPKKKPKFQKQTEQVFQFSDAAHKIRNQTLRYEEKLPWHLEDFDNKNVWRGTYEEAMSGTNLTLVPSQMEKESKKLQTIPLEKWYKFNPRDREAAISFEEVQERMQKEMKDSALLKHATEYWASKDREESKVQQRFTVKGERGERRHNLQSNADGDDGDERPEVSGDLDDIDFNYEDDFADDEEGGPLGEDEVEQAKDTEERVRKEQREANVFAIKEERDFDAEEEENNKRELEAKRLAWKTQKALMKREKNFMYEEDSDGNAYSSSSESQENDERAQGQDEAKDEEQGKDDDIKNHKAPSNSSMRDASTTVNRPTKHADPLRNLKRPGSPSLSEASGSESTSRKKAKKSHPTTNGSNTPRATSPGSLLAAPQPLRASSIGGGYGSGSDVEKSDSGRIRLKPRPSASGGTSPNASRPGSPQPRPSGDKQGARPPPVELPDDIVDRITKGVPAGGIHMTALLNLPGIRPYKTNSRMMQILQSLRESRELQFDIVNKIIYPKDHEASSSKI